MLVFSEANRDSSKLSLKTYACTCQNGIRTHSVIQLSKTCFILNMNESSVDLYKYSLISK